MLQILIKGQTTLQLGYHELKSGQRVLKEELALLRLEMRDGFKKVNERLDRQGKQLAYLEYDAPTRAEHDGLVKRVEKLEKRLPHN